MRAIILVLDAIVALIAGFLAVCIATTPEPHKGKRWFLIVLAILSALVYLGCCAVLLIV